MYINHSLNVNKPLTKDTSSKTTPVLRLPVGNLAVHISVSINHSPDTFPQRAPMFGDCHLAELTVHISVSVIHSTKKLTVHISMLVIHSTRTMFIIRPPLFQDHHLQNMYSMSYIFPTTQQHSSPEIHTASS